MASGGLMMTNDSYMMVQCWLNDDEKWLYDGYMMIRLVKDG